MVLQRVVHFSRFYACGKKLIPRETMAALSTGVELNERNNAALVDAALRGDIATIQAWLEAGGEMNADFYQPDELRFFYRADEVVCLLAQRRVFA